MEFYEVIEIMHCLYVILKQLNIKKKNPIKKMGRRPKQTFHKGRHTHGQETHEKMLNITIIREMQIKPTMRYHLTPVRMAIIKKIYKQ